MNLKVERLQNGESFVTSEKGNSMLPKIKSGQKHLLSPISVEDVKVGDIVFCKVRGRYVTHLVYALSETKGLLIGNNKGRMNGWTKNVFGRVMEIYVG